MLFKKEKPDDKAQPVETINDHERAITCMALSSDQSLLVSGSDDGEARMYSTKTESMECLGVFKGHTDYITSIAIYDTHIITGSADATVRKWDMATCECMDVYQGHASRVFSIACDNNIIFSTSYDRTARAWRFDTSDLDDEEDPCLRIFEGHTKAVLSCIYVAGEDLGYDSDGDGDDFNPGDKFITGSADGTARSWSVESGSCLKTFKGHKGPISCIALDEEGTLLFTSSMDKTVRSWDLTSGRCLKVFEGHENGVLSMQVCKTILYTGSTDGTARSWVVEFGECTRTFKGHGHSVHCLAVAGGIVFTGCGDQMVRAYDAKSGALRRTYKGHRAGVMSLAVVDGFAFSGGSDGALFKWTATDLVA